MDKDNTLYILFRWSVFIIGVFLLALNFNILLNPNDLVVGGMSGLGIIFKTLFGWNATVFVYISSILLLIVSYLLLGKEATGNTIVGSLLYPFMLTLTGPLSEMILAKFDVSEFLIIVALAGIVYGFSNGLIYKMGFTTGGGDVLMQLISKYFNVSLARANFIYSLIIVLASGLIYGVSALIYAIIILVISNIIIDKVQVGLMNNKVFFIYTEKKQEIKEIIDDEFESGYTVLTAESTRKRNKRTNEIIMVAISTRDAHYLKNRILEIDPDAFFIINDCYEVGGGKRRDKMPI